jgi:hypothetical protein
MAIGTPQDLAHDRHPPENLSEESGYNMIFGMSARPQYSADVVLATLRHVNDPAALDNPAARELSKKNMNKWNSWTPLPAARPTRGQES